MNRTALRVFDEANWQLEQASWSAFILPWLDAYRDRRGRRLSHPIHDFLFTYYQMNRKTLWRWRPMADMRLGGEAADRFLDDSRYAKFENGVGLDLGQLGPVEFERARWIRDLIARSLDRPPRFSCFGLHEWAMIYKADCIRHETTPLRLSRREIEEVVEGASICCSHYDAFRFFTPAARRLNTVQPRQEDRAINEQFGCVHFNMDLYRWCYKLNPWVGTELLERCFRIAIEARELDMRASPYDVSAYGYEPIEIENAEGRESYRREQRALCERGQPIAKALVEECERLLGSGAQSSDFGSQSRFNDSRQEELQGMVEQER